MKPTSSAKVISSIKANEKLPVYKTIGGYYLTQVNGLPGYIVANSTTDIVEEEKPNLIQIQTQHHRPLVMC